MTDQSHQRSGSQKKRVIVITGAAGFLGSHLCEWYLKNSYEVIGLDNFSTGQRLNVELLERHWATQGKFHFYEFDVTKDWSQLAAKLTAEQKQGITHVLHFASPASPPLYQKLSLETMLVNSLGTERAVAFADAHGAKVVFASTSEVYGDPDRTPQPESYWGNVNSYGQRACYDEAKRYGESWIYTSNLRNKTRHSMVRIFNTYGPRMNLSDGRVIINLLVQAMVGKALTIYGDGSQTRSFCYVDDLVAGITKYAEQDCLHPMNIGNENEFSILELCHKIQELFPEKKLEINFEPLPADDPRQRRPDLTRARAELLGWEPRISLVEGLEKMKAWLIANPELVEKIRR